MAKREVLDVVNKLGIPIIDFDTRVRKLSDPLSVFPFGLPGHYNAKGYSLLAEQIAHRLRADGFPSTDISQGNE